MRNMEIIRITSSIVHGSRGVMLVDRQPLCVTLELPWRMNKTSESCIPAGEYLCERYNSSRYKETFLVLGVPDRQAILFHPGNYLVDTNGCILPGMSFGSVNSETLILESTRAFQRMIKRMYGHNDFYLTIRNGF